LSQRAQLVVYIGIAVVIVTMLGIWAVIKIPSSVFAFYPLCKTANYHVIKELPVVKQAPPRTTTAFRHDNKCEEVYYPALSFRRTEDPPIIVQAFATEASKEEVLRFYGDILGDWEKGVGPEEENGMLKFSRYLKKDGEVCAEVFVYYGNRVHASFRFDRVEGVPDNIATPPPPGKTVTVWLEGGKGCRGTR